MGPIPGYESISIEMDKVSMRVPPQLGDQIRSGTRPGLDAFLPEATRRLGGFADGCHHLAAATTIGLGQSGALIEEMDALLDSMAP